MEIKVKPKTIVAVVIVIAILIGGYFYMRRTAEMRQYKTEIKQLRLITEHQGYEIKVIEQKAKLESLKAGPTMPPAESPREQELRRKAEANQ